MGLRLYTYLDEDGGITSVTNADSHDGAVEYEYPDSFDVMDIGDYRIVDGNLEYTGEATAAREETERAARREALRSSQLATAAAMYVRATTLSRVDAISVCSLYDEWSGRGVKYYGPNDPDGHPQTWLRYGDDFVRVEQTHTSQPDWTPDAAPSLYTIFKLAPDGIRIWETPTHAENAFDAGEECHYPDADGEVWVSKIDGNTTVPGSDGRWWERSDADTE